MKSVLITILLFAAVMLAIRFHIFDMMSDIRAYCISAFVLIVILLIAFKTLGSPFAGEDNKHEKK